MPAYLVVNADDLGVSRGANLGIVKAHKEGIVTSASLATTTPFYREALACLRDCPELGVGLHFTLTSGRPVSPPGQVPLLVDGAGFLRWRFLSLLRAASWQRRADLLEQIDVELEAQLALLAGDGIRPDHIDGERHVHLLPGIFERVAEAAIRHGIPFIRLGRDLGAGLLGPVPAPALLIGGGLKSALLSALTRRDLRRLPAGLHTAERFASYLYSGRLDLAVRRLLEQPPVEGVTEVMVHPGLPEESRDLESGNRELERYLVSEDRRRELHACIAARAWVDGWRLTSFRRLAAEPARA